MFKALKQNLRVKTFVGTSANALKIQIWTALLAILVVKFLQLRLRFGWSLSRLVALLRQQLFVYRDLWKWLDEPFEPPPRLTYLKLRDAFNSGGVDGFADALKSVPGETAPQRAAKTRLREICRDEGMAGALTDTSRVLSKPTT